MIKIAFTPLDIIYYIMCVIDYLSYHCLDLIVYARYVRVCGRWKVVFLLYV